MATETIFVRTDSLDPRVGSEVEDVVFFNPLTGEKLEIQLGAANRKHFENHLAKLEKYIAAAEIVQEPVPVKAKPAAKANGELTLIREWARANGFTVGDRGRIKAEIKDAYYAAQKTELPVEEVTQDDKADERTDVSEQLESRELRTGDPESVVEVSEILVTETTSDDVEALMAEIAAELDGTEDIK